jgi:hypothetical protein
LIENLFTGKKLREEEEERDAEKRGTPNLMSPVSG